MGRCEIDWSTAEVREGTLTVALDAKTTKPWKARFEAVSALLERNSRRWGEVRLRGGKLQVNDVLPGTEPDLRHELQSIVQQVNADLAPTPDQEGPGESVTDRHDEDPQQRELKERDTEMTGVFQGFAPEDQQDHSTGEPHRQRT